MDIGAFDLDGLFAVLGYFEIVLASLDGKVSNAGNSIDTVSSGQDELWVDDGATAEVLGAILKRHLVREFAGLSLVATDYTSFQGSEAITQSWSNVGCPYRGERTCKFIVEIKLRVVKNNISGEKV